MSGLIKYPEQRAVEDVAFGQGLTPTRLCRVLLPTWRVDVQATLYDSEPYELIDRYLEKAIAHGALGSEQEIADFYGLDAAVTGSAARFLASIGHLIRDGSGKIGLSPIGLRSVHEDRRYIQILEDRRHLYFDGFICRPLARPFYDDRAVTFLEGAHLAKALADTAWDAFTLVAQFPRAFFDPGALSALEQMPAAERDRFNLPEQVIAPTLAGPLEQLYLPAYVVRAVDQAGTVRYLAYTQASQEADPEWSRVCTVAVEVATLVENEYQSGRNEGEEDSVRRWVERRFVGRFSVGWRDGVLIATLPAAAFTGADSLELRRLGSFIKMDGWFFRLWCDDDSLRDRALLDLAEGYLGARAKITADETTSRLARFCRQVALAPMPVAEIALLARKAGKKSLAAQLDKLIE
jgi:hypothetical protein